MIASESSALWHRGSKKTLGLGWLNLRRVPEHVLDIILKKNCANFQIPFFRNLFFIIFFPTILFPEYFFSDNFFYHFFFKFCFPSMGI